ncbi:unnamed protein product [Rotaria magnacalcarata]|uniref:Uncharacterized protein n=1 Tax=Rotaria magnacalcarata TaxID=392030 RepID=A0A815XSY7_9BILA|nr:unnamed protein product [Rotaria magnacalcarata]CAF4654109.1 unnamed protein product [Rotaria magnacalcarata]
MEKKQNNIENNVSPTSLSPALYKIQYPNYRTGMFSLRTPYKNSSVNDDQQQIYTPSSTPKVIHPEYLHVNQITQQDQPIAYESFQRDAEVQCSLLSPDSHDKIIIPRQKIFLGDSCDSDYLSPRYRVQLQLQPTHPNIYEVWNVETPPPRSIPINKPNTHREPSIRIRSPRLVNIKSLSDDDSDYEDHVVYTYYPSRSSYLPSNIRMVCVRQDANTICL